MNAFLEEDVEDLVAADDWADIVADTRERQRQEIAKKMAEFEANGGQVQRVAHGATAWPNGAFVFPSSHNMTTEEVKASRIRRESQFKASSDSDAKAVELMGTLLDTATQQQELCRALGCSPERMHRLIRDYFRDDPRAEKFARRTQEERRADNGERLLPKIKAAVAAGIVGINNIAQHCGTHWKRVSEVNKTYRLGIPKEPAGRKPPATAAYCANEACGKPVHKQARYCPHCGTITAYGVSTQC